MESQTTLITNYLRFHSKPTFNHFTRTNEGKIEDISVKLSSIDKAISLERAWAKAYNNSVVIVRPGKPLTGMIKKTSPTFKYIHQIVVAKRRDIRSLRLTNIKGAADVLNAAANEDEDEEAENDDDEAVNEEAKYDGQADNEDDKDEEAKVSLKSVMLVNAGSLNLGSSIVEIEFLKGEHYMHQKMHQKIS